MPELALAGMQVHEEVSHRLSGGRVHDPVCRHLLVPDRRIDRLVGETEHPLGEVEHARYDPLQREVGGHLQRVHPVVPLHLLRVAEGSVPGLDRRRMPVGLKQTFQSRPLPESRLGQAVMYRRVEVGHGLRPRGHLRNHAVVRPGGRPEDGGYPGPDRQRFFQNRGVRLPGPVAELQREGFSQIAAGRVLHERDHVRIRHRDAVGAVGFTGRQPRHVRVGHSFQVVSRHLEEVLVIGQSGREGHLAADQPGKQLLDPGPVLRLQLVPGHPKVPQSVVEGSGPLAGKRPGLVRSRVVPDGLIQHRPGDQIQAPLLQTLLALPSRLPDVFVGSHLTQEGPLPVGDGAEAAGLLEGPQRVVERARAPHRQDPVDQSLAASDGPFHGGSHGSRGLRGVVEEHQPETRLPYPGRDPARLVTYPVLHPFRLTDAHHRILGSSRPDDAYEPCSSGSGKHSMYIPFPPGAATPPPGSARRGCGISRSRLRNTPSLSTEDSFPVERRSIVRLLRVRLLYPSCVSHISQDRRQARSAAVLPMQSRCGHRWSWSQRGDGGNSHAVASLVAEAARSDDK